LFYGLAFGVRWWPPLSRYGGLDLIVMQLLNIPLPQISIAALIIALGMVVDVTGCRRR